MEELDASVAVNPAYVDALRWRAEVKEALGDAVGARADTAAADRLDKS